MENRNIVMICKLKKLFMPEKLNYSRFQFWDQCEQKYVILLCFLTVNVSLLNNIHFCAVY